MPSLQQDPRPKYHALILQKIQNIDPTMPLTLLPSSPGPNILQTLPPHTRIPIFPIIHLQQRQEHHNS